MTDIEAVVKGLSGVAIALMIVVGLFLVLRHIALWYWRVDTIIERLDGKAASVEVDVNVAVGIELVFHDGSPA